MPTKAYKQTRTWICKIVFRCLVLVCTVAATVFGGIKGASTHWTEMVIVSAMENNEVIEEIKSRLMRVSHLAFCVECMVSN